MSPQGESQTEGNVLNFRGATALSLSLLPFLRQTFRIGYYWFPFPFPSLWGAGKAVARLLYCVLIFTAIIQFIISGMSGITSHLVSQAHIVAQNAHLVTVAVCALPVPFKDSMCAGISNRPYNADVGHLSAWHPFLIDEDVHGPAIDFAIRKAANATSAVLALVRASDLSQRREISDKLKDFLQRAWECELMSGVHIALVKTAFAEILLESGSVFAKLEAHLYSGLLRFVTFAWSRSAEHAILEALATAEEATTTHAHRLVAHGEPVYQTLRFLESATLDISSMLATELATIKREKEEIISKLSTAFGMHRGALRILEGRLVDLRYISDLWREANDLLSLAIHAFNGVRSDLAALSEHQTSPQTARLHVPVDQQNRYFKEWVRRFEARRVLMPVVQNKINIVS